MELEGLGQRLRAKLRLDKSLAILRDMHQRRFEMKKEIAQTEATSSARVGIFCFWTGRCGNEC